MSTSEPSTEPMSREGKGTQAVTDGGRGEPVAWSTAQQKFAEGGWFWLSTVRPDGRPHCVPVFAAWAVPVFYVASNDRARKSRNLDVEGRCVLTKDAGDLHLVVEGTARHAWDDSTLTRASRAFAEVYEWPTRVGESELDADYGAPTSGGPPYQVFEVTPNKAFAFPTDGESSTPTRWTFPG